MNRAQNITFRNIFIQLKVYFFVQELDEWIRATIVNFKMNLINRFSLIPAKD